MKSEDGGKEKKDINIEPQCPLDSPLSISRGGKLGLVSLECMFNCSLFLWSSSSAESFELLILNYSRSPDTSHLWSPYFQE